MMRVCGNNRNSGLVAVHEVYRDGKYWHVVMERMSGGELFGEV